LRTKNKLKSVGLHSTNHILAAGVQTLTRENGNAGNPTTRVVEDPSTRILIATK
jgi:hypothetical protein